MNLKLVNEYYKENDNSISYNDKNYGFELKAIDNFISFPIYSYNYKKLLFTDDSNCVTKYTLYILLPFSFIADLLIFIPRKIRYIIKTKYNKLKKLSN
jgi:hypothetical protein